MNAQNRSGDSGTASNARERAEANGPPVRRVALLTGGGDRPYALGLASSLIRQRIGFDFIGSDELLAPEICESSLVRFLNLRGNQRSDAPFAHKMGRLAQYYARLITYAATSTTQVFHVLWNNKFDLFDRTLLLGYYRFLGKRLVLTVHNVNAGARDGRDGIVNRLTLRIQYALADHLFVHTDGMRRDLEVGFGVPHEKITVVPFGINDTVPNTALTRGEARGRLGLNGDDKVLLFFGNIAPYKGLEHLVRAMESIGRDYPECRLVIAGRPKGSESYWHAIEQGIRSRGLSAKVVLRTEYVPDEDVEVYFKAADVLVLPYLHVFQSGVLFLGYSFGLPAIVTDVGSLKHDVEDGCTGVVCRPGDAAALADAIGRYFASDLYTSLESKRPTIHRIMSERHSWDDVAATTTRVYETLLSSSERSPSRRVE